MLNLLHCGRKFFAEQINFRKIVCAGAGKQFYSFLEHWINESNIDNVCCVLDEGKNNTNIQYLDRNIPVYNAKQFSTMVNLPLDYIVIITNLYSSMDIVENLDRYKIFDNRDCYIEYIIDEQYETQSFKISDFSNQFQIEKKIHYCNT